MKIAIGADHAGYATKQAVVELLSRRGIAVEDVGAHSAAAADYPDYAREVARRVADGRADEGVLICSTGIGMSIAANRFGGVRAALCATPDDAARARTHNNANVLVLGAARLTAGHVEAVIRAWLENAFSAEERHARRLAKIESNAEDQDELRALRRADPELREILCGEIARQRDALNLIASENYASRAVREAQGSALINKYAEGYPGRRWYHGCEFADAAEQLALTRARALFGAEHANVQPHCGSAANMAVYFAALSPGDTILAMSLAHGGHLTHGHKLNFSGRLFNVIGYGVDRATERIDMRALAALAREHKPRLIVVGASAYPRALDFAAFRAVADEAGAMLMVDMAHIAGLVAGGSHASPVPYADFVTTTTHKTLRGPRSGMILCRDRFADDIDRQVFPGIQGGPEMHTVAAKAACLREALQPSFRAYAAQVTANARALAGTMRGDGLRLVSGGTDNHLALVDLTGLGISGADAAAMLERAGIIVNKNAIPFDARGPLTASGIRIGTAAVTTRGMKEPEMLRVGALIREVLHSAGDGKILDRVRAVVSDLTARFPVP